MTARGPRNAEKRSPPDPQPAIPLNAATKRLLPKQLRVGDIVLDRTRADWEEVVSRPVEIAKKHVIARVRVPGRPETEKEQRWEAYERVRVRRARMA